nr:sigma-70 family RNA polymerase sigma factor [Acanthopleuribacter pedis]
MQAHLQGDADAFPQLMEYYRRDLWGFLRNRLHSHADAEDLFQDICLKVFDKLATLKEPSAFRSWLFAIALNQVRKFFTKKRPISLEADAEEEGGASIVLVDPTRLPSEQLELKGDLAKLRRHLHVLKERDRDILLLDVIAEVPQHRIAEMYDMNLNSVKTVIRRAKIKLARLMAEDQT